jgi:hypothetical protein
MRARGILLFLLSGSGAALAACGSASSPPPSPGGPFGPTAPGASPPAGPGDLAVATVDGRPVWASCVAAQLARAARSGHGARTRREALGECIDFELLAQAAEAQKLERAPEVAEARKTALVSRLVETDFEARYRTPDDLRAEIDREYARRADQLDQPELRASAFTRVEVPENAPPEVEVAARALAEKIAAALAGETGLFPVHLRETADRIAAGSGQKVTHADFRPATREALVPPYGSALYSIPEVGRIAAPTRTKWGWDIILLTRIIEPAVHTRDEVAARAFPELRRRQFYRWVGQLASSLGVRVQLDPERVAQLLEPGAQVPSAQAPGPGGTP